MRGEERLAYALRLKGKYYAGQSIRSLVDESGYAYGTVHSLLTLAKTTMRNRGGVRRRPATDETAVGGQR